MSDSNTYPYALEIVPPKTEGGSYQWAIRKHGKLMQRSDRNYHSEAKAHETGMAQIEKLLAGVGERLIAPSGALAPPLISLRRS